MGFQRTKGYAIGKPAAFSRSSGRIRMAASDQSSDGGRKPIVGDGVNPVMSVVAATAEGTLTGEADTEQKNICRKEMKETQVRSLVKAIGWRITACIVTFSTSFYFTGGDFRACLSIVGSDFVSKSGTMYVGERLFNKVQVGRSESGEENTMRSVAKALIWRIFAAVNTMVVSTFFVKKASVGAKIAGADSIFKTSLMVVYERVWS